MKSDLICNLSKIFLCFACSDWFMNGNYLIIIVTVGIILPLAMMKHLGTSLQTVIMSYDSLIHQIIWLFSLLCSCPLCNINQMQKKKSWQSFLIFCVSCNSNNALDTRPIHLFLCLAGYLGYTSGFSLSCMVFFLSAVSLSGYARTRDGRMFWNIQ